MTTTDPTAPKTPTLHDDEGQVPDHTDGTVDDVLPTDRAAVVRREKDEFGGVKVGSAFFGWLTATGSAVLLTALVAAAGAVFSLTTGATVETAQNATADDPVTISIVGGVILLAVSLVAYYCGGYVAGRMARFDGIKQGVAVWVWAVLVAVLVAVVAAVAGDQYDILDKLDIFPRIPVSDESITAGGILAVVTVTVGSLVGAMAGGLAGMRFHRKVDKAGLGA